MPFTHVEQLLAAGAYLQARREAERLLSGEDAPQSHAGRLHHLASRAALQLKDLFGAVRHGEKALTHAQETGDSTLMATVRFDLGCAYTQIGDGHLASSHLLAYLQAQPPDRLSRSHIGTAYCNLAQIARQRKQWAEAIGWLLKAREFAESANHAALELDLAWAHLMLGLPDLAQGHLAEAEHHLDDHPDERLTTGLLYHRALYHRLKGELATSTALCQELFTPGRRATGNQPLAYAAWVMGENALDLGHPSEAMLFVNLALDHAVKGNLPPVMNLAGDLRRRISSAIANA